MKRILVFLVIAFTMGSLQSCSKDETTKVISANKVSLDQETISLVVEATAQLKATVLPEETSDKSITWASADDSIATVDDKGLITAIKSGKTEITATTKNKVKAKCTLTVTKEETAILNKLKSSEYGWKAVYAGNNKEYGASNYILTFGEGTLSIITDNITFKEEINTTFSIDGTALIMGDENPFKKMFIAESDNESNMITDCDFSVMQIDDNSIKLVGATFNTELLLERASADDKNIITESATQSAKLKTFGESNTKEKFFKILKLTGAVEKLIEVDFARWIYTEDYKTMSVTYMDGDKVINDTLQYAYTSKGFKLYKPLIIEGKEIYNFEYNTATKGYTLVENKGVEGTISFSDDKAFTRKGIGAEFISKSHQIVAMANSTLAMSVFKDGADCNFFMGGEVALFIDYEREGKIINSIMLKNNGEEIRTLNVEWKIVGEDLLIAKIANQTAVDEMDLTDGEKVIVDYFLTGFYILPYQAIMGYDTYLFVSKENSSMALGVFMMDTKK
jgi:hypothetical protein